MPDATAHTTADAAQPTAAQTTADLSRRLERVRETIARAAARAGRRAEDVTLVAVSKTVAPELINAAARLGVRDFGENYVQEAAAKRPALSHLEGEVRWHLIGHLQTNKVKAALELFDILQTVDSLRVAQAISRRAAGRTVPVLLEVVLGDDPARLGFRTDELDSAVAVIKTLPGLDLQGLMTVPPLGLSPVEVRRCFSRLRELQEQLASAHRDVRWRHLSMGMSEDYEVAIEEGATIVRVGRAIFGERQP